MEKQSYHNDIPAMTTAQRNALVSPPEKMIIYNTTEKRYEFYDGTSWIPMGGRASTIILKAIDDSTDLAVGDNQTTFVVPSELNGMNLTNVGAHVFTASTSGLPTIQIYNATDAVDMLSTKITIDENEVDSKDATTPPVIDTDNDDVATGDVIRVDCDVAGTGTKGLEVRLSFKKP